jgi:Undecaprenyl-phosphate galactose phosphotransferase WbaP
VASPHLLTVPVVSTELLGSLDAVVPRQNPVEQVESHLHGVGWEARRIRQVLLTGAPLALADLVALATCFAAAMLTVTGLSGMAPSSGNHLHFTALAFSYLCFGGLFRLYPGSATSPVFELRHQITAITLSYFLLVVLNSLFGKLVPVEVAVFGLGLGYSLLASPLARHVARIYLSRCPWWGEKVVIVGSTRQGRSIYRFLESTKHRGLRPVGLVDDSHRPWMGSEADPQAPFLGPIDELSAITRSHDAFWVIAAIADRSPSESREILNCCSIVPNLIVFPTQVMLPSLWSEARECGGQTGILVRDRLLFYWPKFVKRVFDLVVVSILFLFAGPFLLAAAALIKLKSPGPVFYGHARVGKDGKHFKMWKLRSMVVGADKILEDYLKKNPKLRFEWEQTQKLKNDPRVIPGIGAFLRKTSLDELPQLWNVLVGDMSLVGPRPVPVSEVDDYHDCFELYLKVRPGVTGLWQVSGRNLVSYPDRMRLNTYYSRNWSLWLDYYILLRTIRTIALREGAF